ncbi:primosomal protein N' [Roseospira marina]|uniref:Replication restart protein PriA n=1 Tax=Roseospira marina TaxID=140057 RepID=A0A5M6IAX8_9PROT|nr:primosomal protein N' [Roseospira marina]KAA5605396.1 primosomal protein N' [Roseospira marina]MBB4314617.1 primosomal protein N' (replication factor Y) [Roseospira marina]MBB5088778.1 primosomal protein N' (replication factor Y) [Roseospira marina]
MSAPGAKPSGPAANASLFGASRRVAVRVPVPVDSLYDYAVPPELEPLAAGDLVRVPLGKRVELGVVWGEGAADVPETKLRPIQERVDAPPMTQPLRDLVDWCAAYTLAPAGQVLRMALSVPEALDPPRPRTGYTPQVADLAETTLRVTEARQKVLEAARRWPPSEPPPTAADLARRAGVGAAVIKGLAQGGALAAVPVVEDPVIAAPDPHRAGPTLSPDQAYAADALRASARAGFSVTLLEGVTGSGKTEVYFEAIAEALAQGRQALVLLPEIALTARWPDRFQQRFGAPPAPWHSDLPRAQRRDIWRAVAFGRVPVVVGARSALFLPFPDLGLIVVDEEHDSAFKQDEGVPYNARDMAVVRARAGDLAVVLASATPSLETVLNARAGRYEHLPLPERHGGATLPAPGLVDLRAHPPEKWDRQGVPAPSFLAPPLLDAMAETLRNREQTLLFLNRRGYAPLTLCRACGHRLQCPNCSTWLVEHRHRRVLQCHHCDYRTPMPERCPSCDTPDSLAPCGPGVERLAEEVAARFPQARLVVAASDTLIGPTAAAELVERIEQGAVDIIVGTQVMAKGHHFPLLTLVGVVDADLGLAGGDLRAAERTFQLLHQVAGRAGRAQRPGRVLMQTTDPEHPVMQALAANDPERFLSVEAETRRALMMPPFGRLVALIVSGLDESAVSAAGKALARCAPSAEDMEVLGPAPAPLAVLRRQHRHRLLLKAARTVRVQPLVRDWLAAAVLPPGVRVKVDVDPYAFL